MSETTQQVIELLKKEIHGIDDVVIKKSLHRRRQCYRYIYIFSGRENDRTIDDIHTTR